MEKTTWIAVTALLAIGCDVYADGDGISITETRTVAAFDAVSADDGIEVTLGVDAAHTGDVELTVGAESNVMDHLETTVRSGTLSVDIVGDVRTRRSMTVDGVAAPLRRVSANNAALLAVDGVEGTTLEVEVDNAALVDVTGSVDELILDARASGFAALTGLTVVDAVVNLDSAASAEICASGAVTGTVDNAASLVVTCGGDTSGVTTRNGASVSR